MKNIIAIVVTLLTFNAVACNLTQEQEQIDTKASKGMWEEVSGDYNFPPALTDWMTATGLWGTNDDS